MSVLKAVLQHLLVNQASMPTLQRWQLVTRVHLVMHDGDNCDGVDYAGGCDSDGDEDNVMIIVVTATMVVVVIVLVMMLMVVVMVMVMRIM